MDSTCDSKPMDVKNNLLHPDLIDLSLLTRKQLIECLEYRSIPYDPSYNDYANQDLLELFKKHILPLEQRSYDEDDDALGIFMANLQKEKCNVDRKNSAERLAADAENDPGWKSEERRKTPIPEDRIHVSEMSADDVALDETSFRVITDNKLSSTENMECGDGSTNVQTKRKSFSPSVNENGKDLSPTCEVPKKKIKLITYP